LISPYIVAVDVTYKCTYRCLHCYNFSGDDYSGKRELSDEKLYSVIMDVGKLLPSSICFCGGEPLLRKEVLFKVSTELRKLSDRMSINMVTNGELLTEETAESIILSGFSLIQVSIDGSNAVSHDWLRNHKGAFDSAVRALKFLNQKRVEMNANNLFLAISFAPNKRNSSEIIDTIDLCESLGVNYFRIQPLMLIGRAKHNLANNVMSSTEYRLFTQKIFERMARNRAQSKMAIEWGDPIDHLLADNHEKYPFLSINAFGEILVSPYLPITVGKILDVSIDEYLKKGLFEKLWKNDLINYIRHKIVSPEKMDISEKVHLPELMHGFVEFDFLKKTFEEQTARQLDYIKSKRCKFETL